MINLTCPPLSEYSITFPYNELIVPIAEKSTLDVEKYFLELLRTDNSLSAGIAAIKTLLMVLKQTKCKKTVN